MSYLAPRAVVMEDPMHATLSHSYATGEAVAHMGSAEASARAGALGGYAAAASTNASISRMETINQTGRTALQGRYAADASAREGATAAVHQMSTIAAAQAGAEVTARGVDVRLAEGQLVSAEGVLGAKAIARDAAGRVATERDVHNYNAANAAVHLGVVRNERSAEAEFAAIRANAAGTDASNARAAEQAAGALAHEASAAAALIRTKASTADANAAAAEHRRAELAAAAANAAAAAREAAAAERAATTALALAGREADIARVTAAQTRAEAAAVEQQARARALHHGATQTEADSAARRAASEHAGAVNATTRLSLADRDARYASADAAIAANESMAARVDLAARGTEEMIARGQVAEAHGSLRRSGRMLEGAAAAHVHANAQEMAARGVHGQAMTQASIESARHINEQHALSVAGTREVMATSAEAGAHASARVAGYDALRADGVARTATMTRAVHDASPRTAVAYVDSLHGTPISSPVAMHPSMVTASPVRVPHLDAKYSAINSPLTTRLY